MAETKDEAGAVITKVIDMKISLTWLISTAVVIILSIGGMYAKMDQVGNELIDLKATVRAGNLATGAVQSEMAVLRYRVDSLERHSNNGIKDTK